MQQSVVSMIIFLYIFICTALLLFNLVYMLSTGLKKRMKDNRMKREKAELQYVVKDIQERADRKYQKRLYRKLKNPEQLLVYVEALERNQDNISEEEITAYICTCRGTLFDIAEVYQKKAAMERVLFAYLISRLPIKAVKEFHRMGELLLPYLDHSTVYCRENVLQALYRLGGEDALVRAFQILQENKEYHDPKLIADGLAEYTGDKTALARRLWKYKWDDTMRAAVIQFMNQLPEDLTELVLPELTDGQPEGCFAAIRYFGHHICEEAEPVLLRILQEEGNVAASAAQSLGSYPSRETKEALKTALRSPLWHVRRNAAEALVKMNLTEEEIKQLREDEDQYAGEMFVYALESAGRA